MPIEPGVRAAFIELVGSDHVLSCAEATAVELGGCADAVIKPNTSLEVAEAVRTAMAWDLTVSLPDGTVLIEGHCGHVVLNLARLNKIVEVDCGALRARVQPNVVYDRLHSELASKGLGVARVHRDRPPTATDSVLSVEVVSRFGQLVRASRQPTEGLGDFVDLLVGLDGIHCVATEFTIALLPVFAVARVTAVTEWPRLNEEN